MTPLKFKGLCVVANMVHVADMVHNTADTAFLGAKNQKSKCAKKMSSIKKNIFITF